MLRNFLVLVVVILAACNQETVIGTELITDQVVDIAFTDNIDISAKSIPGEPLDVFIATENGTTNLSLMLIGQSDDQFFGKAQSTAFFTVNLNTTDTLDNISIIDSIVLTIPLDTLGGYGDDDAIHQFELFELNESLYEVDTFKTNRFFDFDPVALGQRSFVPNARDSIRAYEPSLDSMINFRAHIRVPITDQTFIDKLTDATIEANGNDTTFREEIYGFALRSSTEESGFVAMNMGNALASITEVNIYYVDNGEQKIYSYPLGSRRSIAFEHDLTDSDANLAITDPLFADSLIYIQGMRGPNIELDLSALKTLTKGSVNYAELEFHVATLMGDNIQDNPPIDRIGAFYKNEDGDLRQVRDLIIGDGSINFLGFFDGSLVEGMDTLSYSMTLSTHTIDVINENVATDKIILVPFNKQTFANRAIIFGPKHSERPMKLKIVQTNP